MNNQATLDVLEKIAVMLESDEYTERHSRAARYINLTKICPLPLGGLILPGGEIASAAFIEARQAYYYGMFVSAIVLSQVFLEHYLCGIELWNSKHNSKVQYKLEKTSFDKIIKDALSAGRITQEEWDLFDQLRKLRNPYTHFRGVSNSENLLRRAMDSMTPAEDLTELDALHAVRAIGSIISRQPFPDLKPLYED
jgi:hypothetical protein